MTLAVVVEVDVLPALPKKMPLPEPVAAAVDTASPGGGFKPASETPPGPTMRCVPLTPPVMSMRNSCVLAAAGAVRSTLSRAKRCTVAPVSPALPSVLAAPPTVSEIW